VTVVWAVVVAGGSGARFGAPKQFALLGGRPVVSWAVEACRSVAEGVVLVLPEVRDDEYGADRVVAGGSTRSASVRAGLHAVPEQAEVVVVHDAARPLATPATFAAVVSALADGLAAGAVCALPAADTLKRVDRPLGVEGSTPEAWPVVVETLERAATVVVQTPQAFSAEALRRAHRTGGEATDDAGLVESLGATVRVVPGDHRNLKLTTPADLAYAEQLLAG
jgi:2-C-methyl-D-erythritol 4-phosphate cytidylyltransferase